MESSTQGGTGATTSNMQGAEMMGANGGGMIGTPMPKPKSKKKMILAFAIGAVALALITLSVIFFILPMFANGPAGGVLADPTPLLYADGDEIYLASGQENQLLSDADVAKSDDGVWINGMASWDNHYVYYLADVDKKTGTGELMVVKTDGSGSPESVDKGVCSARVSSDGSRILYFKDIQDGVGDLYSRVLEKKPELIDEGVTTLNYGFSNNGKNVYYVKQLAEGDIFNYTLYIKNGDAKVLKVEQVSASSANAVICSVTLGNNGKSLFTFYSAESEEGEEPEDPEQTLSLFAEGESEKIGTDSLVWTTFADVDDFLYYSDRTLYYKASGEDKVRLSQDFVSARFAPYYGADLNHVYEKRFLLVENDATEDEPYPEDVTLYEQVIGEDKIKITKANAWSYNVNADFTWISFERDSGMCLMQKTGNKWGDRIDVCEYSINSQFDMSGNYFYYIEGEDEEAEYGDLYRYSLKNGESELLQYDVAEFYLIEDNLYSRTTEDQVFRIKSSDDKEKLKDDIYNIYRAKGGLYLVTNADEYDVYYLAKGADETETILQDASGIVQLGWMIDYTMPVPEDVQTTLKEMYEDAQIVLDIYNETSNATISTLHRTYDDSKLLAETMHERTDISQDIKNIIDDFYFGFSYISLGISWEDLNMSTEAQNSFDDAAEMLESAIEAYDIFL